MPTPSGMSLVKQHFADLAAGHSPESAMEECWHVETSKENQRLVHHDCFDLRSEYQCLISNRLRHCEWTDSCG